MCGVRSAHNTTLAVHMFTCMNNKTAEELIVERFTPRARQKKRRKDKEVLGAVESSWACTFSAHKQPKQQQQQRLQCGRIESAALVWRGVVGFSTTDRDTQLPWKQSPKVQCHSLLSSPSTLSLHDGNGDAGLFV